MFKPEPMQKIVVIGISDFLPKTLSLLHDLKVVQIEPIKDEILKLAKLQSQLDIGKIVAEEYLRIRALKTALPPKPVKEKRKFSNIDEVLEVCKSVNIDDVVSQIKKEQSEIQVRIEQLKNILEIAKNLSYINEDLSIFTTSSTSSFFAILKKENFEKIKDFMKKLNANVVYNVSEEKDRLKVIFIVNNKDLEKFGSAIQKVEAKFYELNNLKGTPKEIIDNSQKEISKLLKRENELKEKLNDLADKYYSILLIIEEQLSIEQKKIEVLTQLAR